MLQDIFKQYLKEQIGTKKEISNIKRANQSLLIRIAKCFNTLLENQAGVDYYTPIYGNNFNIDNKVRHKTLAILKQEKMIEVKTNKDGKQSWQSKYNGRQIRNDINNPTPKSYCFTKYGWSLVQQQEFVEEIKQLTQNTKKKNKYQSPEEFADQMLRKAAEDNLSLTFKLSKPLPIVVKQYLEAVKDEWHVNESNYNYKLKEAEKVIMTTIHNFNNKLLKFNQRMYTALSLCPKELRKYILTPDGQQIDEGFDINSSIYTLLGDTLEYYMKQKNISIPVQFYQEKKQLIEWCFDKDKHIYVRIGEWNGKHYTKEQIKPHNMQVLFSNNEDIQKRDQKNGPRNQIKDFVAHHFPTMWSLLINFEQENNPNYEQELNEYNKFIEDISLYNAGLIKHYPKHINPPKKVKSTIWRYFHQIETFYELKLKETLESENNNITAYWIHDCLCFKTSSLTPKFKTHIQSTFKALLSNFNQFQIAFNQFQNGSNQFQNYLLLYGACMVEDDKEKDSILYGAGMDVEKIADNNEFEILMDEINNLTS